MWVWHLLVRVIGLLAILPRVAVGQITKLPRLMGGAGKSILLAIEVAGKFGVRKIATLVRAIGRGSKWTARKVWRWKKWFLVFLLVVGTLLIVLFTPQIQRAIFWIFLNPLTIFWLIAGVSAVAIKKLKPHIGKKGKEVHNIFWLAPLGFMAIFTPFWLVWNSLTNFIPKWLIPSWKHVIMFAVLGISLGVIYLTGRVLIQGISTTSAREEKAKEVLGWILGVVVSLAVINWLLWTLDEELWNSVWVIKSRFWAINLGILLAILLLFVAKGADGKPHPVAKIFSWVIGGLVATILFVCLWDFITEGKGWSLWAGKLGDMVSRTHPRVDNQSHSAPMEIARAVIGDCESGDGNPGSARQFEPDGVTPIKNREGSGAFGIYQFLESHREPAKKLGFNLDTKEGQDGYFAHRYKLQGTRDWESDARSKACWEPKLRAYTWGGEEVSLVVVAPLDRESEVIPTPQKNGGGKFDLSGGGKKYQVRWNVGMPSETVETLPRAKDAFRLQPDVVYNLSLKSAEKEPVSVVVKFY